MSLKKDGRLSIMVAILKALLVLVVFYMGTELNTIIDYLKTVPISSSDLAGLQNRINQEKAVKNHQPDKYAALIRGSNEYPMFAASIGLAYQVLLENGFKQENIYVLANIRGKEELCFHPVDDIAIKENVKTLTEHLSNIVDEEDLIFVYLFSHGDRVRLSNSAEPDTAKETTGFRLKDEHIFDFELKSYLSKIHPKQGVLLFDFCFSGEFPKNLGKGEYAAISSTAPDMTASGSGGSFSGFFLRALSWRERSEADISKDGRVSLQEAFDYAKEHHSATRKGKQRPVIKSDIPLDKIFIDK